MENSISNDNPSAFVEGTKYENANEKIDKIAAQAKERVKDLKAIETALVDLRNAHARLNFLWNDFTAIEDASDILNNGYPYKQSFDEINIDEWVIDVRLAILKELNELA